ncbi:cytochrome b561 and DOMON domain-containing protein At5g47530-like [Gastrolobium bilobum]|uniref:cytochrome b561 and DOMON domain-containing protein At5g47530-like n=1 Tax=Gastrolobium bilobum TaxID=150636 RepID=UPI002AB1F59E|nr:cytochrome b561 and DOMON domain-containing protein At5g47530-like [Gastrolobium bilobum]
MVGSQAFVAVLTSYGTFKACTSPITSYVTLLQHGNLSFPVPNVLAIYINSHKIIFASFQIPSNGTLVNHVWQEGFAWDDGTSKAHFLSGPNLLSFATLDFTSGNVSETGVEVNSSNTTLKNVHGILSSFSWGFLMQLGVIFGYVKECDCGCGASAGVLHRAFVSLAFFIGSGGFVTGLYLGNHNHSGVHNASHRFIGITPMYLTHVQIFVARFLKPENNHKYKIFWKTFHFIVGYSILFLAMLNLVIAFSILNLDYDDNKANYYALIIFVNEFALFAELVFLLVLILNSIADLL